MASFHSNCRSFSPIFHISPKTWTKSTNFGSTLLPFELTDEDRTATIPSPDDAPD
jgi:hypothetical protein